MRIAVARDLTPPEELIRHTRARHPELRHYELRESGHASIRIDELEARMRAAYTHTYEVRDRARPSRFDYTRGYLRWVLAPEQEGSCLITLEHLPTGRTAGSAFLVPRRILIRGTVHESSIVTGLSIDPDHTGIGCGQLLHFACQRRALEQGPDVPHFYWWDGALRGRWTCRSTVGRNDSNLRLIGSNAILYKVLDAASVRSALRLSLFEKLALRAMRHRNRSTITAHCVTPRTATEICEFLADSSTKAVSRAWSPDELLREATFTNPYPEDPFRPIVRQFRDSRGGLLGIFFGYVLPVVQTGRIQALVIDHLFCRNGLEPEITNQMIRGLEAAAIDAADASVSIYMGAPHQQQTFARAGYAPRFPGRREMFLGAVAPDAARMGVERSDIVLDHK